MSHDLEVLRFENSKESFPKHYHETFCITLMESGLLAENEKIIPRGNILISHPFEVHSNQSLSENGYTFTTLYISDDLMKVLCLSDKISFDQQVHENYYLYHQFSEFVKKYTNNSADLFASQEEEKALTKLVCQLFDEFGQREEFKPELDYDSISYFKTRLESLAGNNINLDKLSSEMGMNKYQFIRWFKKQTGLTPFEYILLQRVERSRRLIKEGLDLAKAALESGFYDQSHFSRYFKKFVGLTPSKYQSAIFYKN